MHLLYNMSPVFPPLFIRLILDDYNFNYIFKKYAPNETIEKGSIEAAFAQSFNRQYSKSGHIGQRPSN
jgi:hypothetical protein